MSTILVVDDELTVLAAFTQLLSDQGYEVITARAAEDAFTKLHGCEPDLVLMDIRMPGMNGLEALQQLKRDKPRLPVIIMTGQSTTEWAIEATKRGAFDYQVKPFEPEEMLHTIEGALECVRLMQDEVAIDADATSTVRDAIIGQSAGMRDVYKAIGRVAPTDATVLIRGESGTGKELVARAVYQHSFRNHAPLVVINCVATPESLLESELFGHEKGAFTDAVTRRMGKFELANRGTVFLDEIGDVPLGVQAKILRVLQERCFERVGGLDTIRSDFRLIAATNRNLEQAIRLGTFREDLFHRLNVVTIELPPLRQRREDIPALTRFFLQRFAAEQGIEQPALSEGAMEVLQSHNWPGNVRQLQHCVFRMLIFNRGYPIQAADIQRTLEQISDSVGDDRDEQLLKVVRRYLDGGAHTRPYEELVARLERLLIAEALQRTNGNQTQAAALLGLARPTLHAKICKHQIITEGDRSVSTAADRRGEGLGRP